MTIVSNVIEFLKSRQSCGQLQEPAPDAVQLFELMSCGRRAPDHGQLRPYRFLVIQDFALEQLGTVYQQALLQQDEVDVAKLERVRGLPLRAPMVITAIFSPVDSTKAPGSEQLITAGIAAGNIVTAAQAMGFGAYWRTGEMAYNTYVAQQLGLSETEKIIGFIYVGTPKNTPLAVRTHDDVNAIYRPWPDNV